MARQRKFPRHFVVKESGFYFQATPAMRVAGICSESLGTDMTAAKARAETLNAAWDAIRRGEEPVGKAPARPARSGTLSSGCEPPTNTGRKSRERSTNWNMP